MVIPVGGDERLRARPMAIAELEPSCRVWIITSRDSAKVQQIENRTAVHLSMQRECNTHLSIDGHADSFRARLAAFLFKSTRGRLPMPIKLFLAPVLLGASLYNGWKRATDSAAPFTRIRDGLWLGRRLLPGDLLSLQENGITALLDEIQGLRATARLNRRQLCALDRLADRPPIQPRTRATIVASVFARGAGEPDDFKGRRVEITCEPAEDVTIDGKIGGRTPIEFEAIPRAIQVLVAPEESD